MWRRCFVFLVIVFFSYSCIERYFPDEVSDVSLSIVIDGLITDQHGGLGQRVYVSQSTAIDTIGFNGLVGCIVIVSDAGGNKYTFLEDANGTYVGNIPDSIISSANSFQLEVLTPNGKIYSSDIEQITPTPIIDSVYYEIEVVPTTDPNVSYFGAQFFIDFRANDDYGSYYRFEIEESYEYHSQWPIQLYLNENHELIDGSEDFSYYYCYKTEKLNQVFTLSTEGFTNNSYIKFPLHAVSNQTQRLRYNYSFKIKQYALSKSAHTFWNSIRENSQEADNVFGKQPSSIRGNVRCLTHPDEEVLGFFGVSSVKEKRITYKGGIDMPFNYAQCEPIISDILPPYRPLYLMYIVEDGVDILAIQITKCVICTELGGTTEKPEFFNN